MTFFPKVINSMYKKSVLQDFILQAKFKLNFLICSFLQNVHSKGCYYYFHSRDIIFVADYPTKKVKLKLCMEHKTLP